LGVVENPPTYAVVCSPSGNLGIARGDGGKCEGLILCSAGASGVGKCEGLILGGEIGSSFTVTTGCLILRGCEVVTSGEGVG